jgi:hypothetical protein
LNRFFLNRFNPERAVKDEPQTGLALKESFGYFEQEHVGRIYRNDIRQEVHAGVDYRNGRRRTFWSTFGKNYSELLTKKAV